MVVVSLVHRTPHVLMGTNVRAVTAKQTVLLLRIVRQAICVQAVCVWARHRQHARHTAIVTLDTSVPITLVC